MYRAAGARLSVCVYVCVYSLSLHKFIENCRAHIHTRIVHTSRTFYFFYSIKIFDIFTGVSNGIASASVALIEAENI